MYPAYVGAHVWRMLRPIGAVGTIVPRWLTALNPPVILKIVLHAEHAVAIAAGKRSRVSVARRGDDVPVRKRPIIVIPPRARRHRLGGCKKKAQNVFVIHGAPWRASLNLYSDSILFFFFFSVTEIERERKIVKRGRRDVWEQSSRVLVSDRRKQTLALLLDDGIVGLVTNDTRCSPY